MSFLENEQTLKKTIELNNMDNMNKVIFHIDVDSFFVAAELIYHPELRGKDISISYNHAASIVSALSYSAKKKGAKVPMKLFEVKKICPDIINLKPNYNLYEKVSNKIYNFLKKKYTRKIEIGSIDEWYLDVSNLMSSYSPIELASKIQKDIKNEINVEVSIGISYNKFLAKMATDINKPFGITLINKEDIKSMIWPLKINEFIGIGKSSVDEFIKNNIFTIGDLANAKIDSLSFSSRIKNILPKLINNAKGYGDSYINTNNDQQSISRQYSFDGTIKQRVSNIYSILRKLLNDVIDDLNKINKVSNTLSVQIKYYDKKLVQITSQIPWDLNNDEMLSKAILLFNKLWNESEVMMIGVGLSFLKDKYKQSRTKSLFDNDEESNKNKDVVKNIIIEVNSKIKSNNLKLLKDK